VFCGGCVFFLVKESNIEQSALCLFLSFWKLLFQFRSDIVRLVQLLQTSQGNIKSRSHRNLRFLAVRMDFNLFYEKLTQDLKETTSYKEGAGEHGGGGGGGSRLTASQLVGASTPMVKTNQRIQQLNGGGSEWGSPLVPLE
jgi:hypothetical protein